MARSFWKRRKDTMTTTTEYNQPVATSRSRSIIMTIAGIVIVGLLFFGVFWAARWAFGELSDDGSQPVAVTTNDTPVAEPSAPDSASTSNQSSPSITVTSSTSTTTPSTASTTTTSTTTSSTNALPNTGPESIVPFFFGALIVSYLLYRKKLTS